MSSRLPAFFAASVALTGVITAVACGGASSQGAAIAYSSKAGIQLVKLDGTGGHVIGSGLVSAVTWSPDGRQLAFVRDDGLYVIDRDGSGTRLIASSGTRPTWSPDASRLAFDRYSATECSVSGPSRLRLTIADVRTGRLRDISALEKPEKLADLGIVEWSPGGRRLLYEVDESSSECGRAPTSRLYTIGVDGTGRSLLATADSWLPGAAWSPDGRRIAYLSSDGVWVAKVGGYGAKQLAGVSSGLGSFGSIAWHSRRELVLTADGGGCTGLCGLDVGSRQLRPIDYIASGCCILAVSKDGERIGVLVNGTVSVVSRGRVKGHVKVPPEADVSLFLP